MTWTRSAGSADLLAQAGGAVLGVGDDGVHAAEDAVGGGDLAAARLGRKDVVGGHHPRPGRRQQAGVEARQGEPLVVDDVGVGRRAAEAPHVAQVLGELEAEAAFAANPRSALRR